MSWFRFLSCDDRPDSDPPRASLWSTVAVYAAILLCGASLLALSRAYEFQVEAREDRLRVSMVLDDIRGQAESARLEQERRDLELCRILMGEGLDGECRRVAMAGVEGGAK